MKNILIIWTSDYETSKNKGVFHMLKLFDEGGYFKNLLFLAPITKNNKIISCESNIKFIEYGWKSKFTFFNKYKITKAIGAIKILLKLCFIFPFIVKKENISIIRATDPYYMGLIGLFYSKIFGIPLVVSIHSDYDKRYILDGAKGSFVILGSRKIAKKLEKFIYQKCTMILPIRDYMRQNIIEEYGISENKIKVFPHGVDIDKFENYQFIGIHKKFNIDINKHIISFVGRLSSENYIYDTIEIVQELLKIRQDFIFLIIGGGVEYENYKEKIENEKLDTFIKIVGFQPQEIVANARKQSSVSLCLMAGFSLIEACLASRPIISYNIEWHGELVQNDKTGYLVDESNTKDVTKKINYLLNNKDESKRMGKNARELAIKNHSLHRTVEIKQNIYKELF